MARFFRILRSASILIVAGALVSLGTPRLFAALVTLPSRPILNSIQANKDVDKESLEILIKSQERGLSWNESARSWTDLGLAQFLLANKDENENSRTEFLEKAEESLVKGLILSPSNAFAWTRLAYVDIAKNGPSPTVSQKLRLAVSGAPYDRRLVFTRLRMSFLAWPLFEDTDRPMILDQTRFAWKINPKKLVVLGAELGRTGIIRAALFTNANDMGKLEILLKKVNDKKN